MHLLATHELAVSVSIRESRYWVGGFVGCRPRRLNRLWSLYLDMPSSSMLCNVYG